MSDKLSPKFFGLTLSKNKCFKLQRKFWYFLMVIIKWKDVNFYLFYHENVFCFFFNWYFYSRWWTKQQLSCHFAVNCLFITVIWMAVGEIFTYRTSLKYIKVRIKSQNVCPPSHWTTLWTSCLTLNCFFSLSTSHKEGFWLFGVAYTFQRKRQFTATLLWC